MTDETSTTPDPAPDTRLSPAEAFTVLLAGNRRFAQGRSAHADQGLARRAEVAGGQQPFALVFGCGDSRVSAEIVFDQGLGRLFVVRTAGHVVDSGVLGSVEFGVAVLAIPLVVVLGHDSCGAVRAGLDAVETGEMPVGFIRDIVERVTPSVLAAQRAGDTSSEAVEAEHVRQTVRLLIDRSAVLARAIESGRTAVVGLSYALAQGDVSVVEVSGSAGL